MAKDPAMPFYVNDYLASPRVMCMTLEQQGAYVRLLCLCWASGDASLPDDDKQLASLSGMGEGWFANGSHLVRACFEPHPNKNGFLTNKKIFELLQKRIEWKSKSRAGGIKSGESRRLRQISQSTASKGGCKGGSQMVGDCFEPKGNISFTFTFTIRSLVGDRKKVPTVPFDITDTPIPDSLSSQEFVDELVHWCNWRMNEKGTPVSQGALIGQLNELSKYSQDVAIEAIRSGIRNDHIGLFPGRIARDMSDGSTSGKRKPKPIGNSTWVANRKGNENGEN